MAAGFEILGIGIIIPILNIFAGNDFLKYTQYFDLSSEIYKNIKLYWFVAICKK